MAMPEPTFPLSSQVHSGGPIRGCAAWWPATAPPPRSSGRSGGAPPSSWSSEHWLCASTTVN